MIPLFRPRPPDLSVVMDHYQRSIATGMLTNFGPCFEDVRRELHGSLGGHWLPVSNGTTALELLVSMLPEKCQRVLVPDFTFAATILAVIRAGRIPVIGACEGHSLMLSRKALTRDPGAFDAILGVVPFGYWRPEIERLEDFAKNHDKPLIWDLAGAWPMVRPFPSAYSLHAAKSLPIGEGGLIRFPNHWNRDWAQQLSCFGFDHMKRCISPRGFNGKMDEMHCAMLLTQLHYETQHRERMSRLRELIMAYQKALAPHVLPFNDEVLSGFPSIAALRGLPARKLVRAGEARGIVFRPYYAPLLSAQPAFQALDLVGGQSERLLKTVVGFPSDVTQDEFEQVVDCALSVLS